MAMGQKARSGAQDLPRVADPAIRSFWMRHRRGNRDVRHATRVNSDKRGRFETTKQTQAECLWYPQIFFVDAATQLRLWRMQQGTGISRSWGLVTSPCHVFSTHQISWSYMIMIGEIIQISWSWLVINKHWTMLSMVLLKGKLGHLLHIWSPKWIVNIVHVHSMY